MTLEQIQAKKCKRCGGEWIEPYKEGSKGKPDYCRNCQVYYHTRFNLINPIKLLRDDVT